MIYAASFGHLIDGQKGLDIVVAHTQTRYPEWQERGDSAAAPVGTHLEIPAGKVTSHLCCWLKFRFKVELKVKIYL